MRNRKPVFVFGFQFWDLYNCVAFNCDSAFAMLCQFGSSMCVCACSVVVCVCVCLVMQLTGLKCQTAAAAGGGSE